MQLVGRGSLVKMEDKPDAKCRVWQIRQHVLDGGKDSAKTHVVRGTLTHAREEQDAFRAKLKAMPDSMGIGMTFAQYRIKFIDWQKTTKRSEKTISKNDGFLRTIGKHLDPRRMADIGPGDIEAVYGLLRKGESLSGKPLSETSLSCINGVLHSMFKRALRDGVVQSDPMEQSDVPKPDTEEKKAMTAAQQQRFVAKLHMDFPNEPATYLCSSLGLRREESIGVAWKDFSGKRGARMLHIPASKTNAGIRDIPVPETVWKTLTLRKKVQIEAMRKAGVRWNRSVKVNADAFDHNITPDNFTQWWTRNCKRFDLEGWTLHELRHTFATLLAESGADPKTIQYIMGHRSPLTALNIYNHVHQEHKIEAMDKMAEMLDSKGRTA